MAQPETPPVTGPPPPLPSQGEDLPAKRWGEAGSLKPSKPEQPFFYGGQAVIEGVTMRGKQHYPVAVRLPTTKENLVDKGELKASIHANPLWNLPLVRRPPPIREQLHLGLNALISAS